MVSRSNSPSAGIRAPRTRRPRSPAAGRRARRRSPFRRQPSGRPAASSARGRCCRGRSRRGRRSRGCSRASRAVSRSPGRTLGIPAGRRRALGGDPARRVVEGDDLLRAEEGLARGHHQLAPGRRRRQLLVRALRLGLAAAPTASRSAATRRSPGRAPPARRGRRSRRRRSRSASSRSIPLVVEGGFRQPVAGRSRCRGRRSRAAAGPSRRSPARPTMLLVEHGEAGDLPRSPRGSRAIAARVSPSSSLAVDRGQAAGRVERAGEQARWGWSSRPG